MADVVFDEEVRMRKNVASMSSTEGSVVVRFFLRKGIAKSKQQAVVYVILLSIALYIGTLYGAEKAGVIDVGITSFGEPEETVLPPWQQLELLEQQQQQL